MQRISKLLTWRPLAVAAVLALAAAAGSFVGSTPTTSATTATTYVAWVGGDVPGAAATFVNVFEPSAMIITEGDSIQWKNNSAEPHTVSFFNNQPPPKELTLETVEDPIGGRSPAFDGTKQIHSGFIVPDLSTFYTVKFSKAGSYAFICAIHPGMDGNVTVLSAGLYVPTQAQIDADGKRVQASGEAAARRMVAAAPTAATRSANPNGTSTWTVASSPLVKVPGGFVAPNLFTPARVSIGAGDTVTWLNDIEQAHTITFLGGGPPKGNPLEPTKDTSYTGGYAGSGILGKGAPFFVGTKYSLTFPQPGSYPFVCILHVDQGMAGVVEVGPAGSGAAGPAAGGPPALRPPSTGDAGLTSSAPAAWPLALAVAFAGIATLGVMRARARI